MANTPDPFTAWFELQSRAMQSMVDAMPAAQTGDPTTQAAQMPDPWAQAARALQVAWSGAGLAGNDDDTATGRLSAMMPLLPPSWFDAKRAQEMAEEQAVLWQNVMGDFTASLDTARDADTGTSLPRSDRRFSDKAWRGHPAFALVHQTYLMLADHTVAAIENMDGVPEAQRMQLKFAAQMLVDAVSPDNFAMTNPVVLKRTVDTGGQNLVKGMQHLAADLERGQLTHTDPDAFVLGENLAATPGKVVHETPLYQLIQYAPATDDVLAVPLVIFPPWINRFYILDLTPKKSFVKWAVDQGLTVFVVSWKSADESMKDVVWDDYIRAQIDAIDTIRARLDVPAVHTIGYCVSGTTLAATLAILERRGEADRVASATFFTAQVDFEDAGELLQFIDGPQLDMIEKLSGKGYLDGRYLAAAFNALRSRDLIWNYVVNNYLLGEDYPAFDLLHWNGDVTNLPAKWHGAYLRDLYRDNRLVEPDALSADGTPIDLTRIKTPAYIQAGKEDHIAPANSVWKMTDHLAGDVTFVLAGSGHIAGVVNPPAANKYQYWTGDAGSADLDTFRAGATEHPGSWWPHWIEWLRGHDKRQVAATGKRAPGGKGDTVIEDAPGRYVKQR